MPTSTRDAPHELKQGEVHVWLADPDAGPSRTLLRRKTLLSPQEMAGGKRFGVAGLRRRHLLGRALLREALSRYSPIAPRNWRFEVAPGGKPTIASPVHAGLCFSLSSTSGLVACAIAISGSSSVMDLGLDVEAAEGTSPLTLAERLLTPGEARALRRLPPRLQRHRFYELWTLKEAYLKAQGVGLAVPLRGFGFRLGKRITLEPAPAAEPGTTWRFEVLRPTRAHRAAVAVRLPHGNRLEVITHWWD